MEFINWSYDDLRDLIQNKVEEGRGLEYKSAAALEKSDRKKNEISKDVSSFANSNGGVLIYGISEFDDREKSHLPEKIDPVDSLVYTKEWLEHVINNKIQPKIRGIEIDVVRIPDAPNQSVYIVKIPKSSTAHQAAGYKYYKRYNFEAVPMDDFEVRDVMNRSTHPKMEIRFEIEQGKSPALLIFIQNEGEVFARYVNYYLLIESRLLSAEEATPLKRKWLDNTDYLEYYGENTVRDVVGGTDIGGTFYPNYGPSRYDTILPKMHSRPERLQLDHEVDYSANSVLKWKVYADNAPVVEGQSVFSDIPIRKV